MHCPYCSHRETRVIDSRLAESGSAVRRRRSCEGCGKRFSTFERVDLRLPMVIKKDGSRQSFDADKLRRGMARALEKRPVSAAQLEHAVQRITQLACEMGEGEIGVEKLGELVMDELRSLDGVAYVRFASVYRDFKDVDAFLAAVKSAIE